MNTNKHLPKAFINQIQNILGKEAQDYFDTFESPAQRALRCNRLKTTSPSVLGLLEKEKKYKDIDSAYLLSSDYPYGKSIYHELGAYYIQEPSAMTAVEILNPKPGEFILDLCAAPGSKSTQIGERMQNQGLFVANEIIRNRALILSENIKRQGIRNALILNNSPKSLENIFQQFFDAILVDAPCSGEGMFRKNPEVIAEWSEEHVQSCAIRQKEILLSALSMLKPGGRLVYSTCTLNEVENERLVESLCREYSLQTVPFSFQGKDVSIGMLKLWPHKFDGEGHFVALLQKSKEGARKQSSFISLKIEKPLKEELQIYEDFCNENQIQGFPANFKYNNILMHVPEIHLSKGLNIINFGIRLGEVKKNIFFPDYAFAIAIQDNAVKSIELKQEDAQKYIAGHALSDIESKEKGFILLRYDNYPLAWGKIANGVIKNHYPKHLRKIIQL